MPTRRRARAGLGTAQSAFDPRRAESRGGDDVARRGLLQSSRAAAARSPGGCAVRPLAGTRAVLMDLEGTVYAAGQSLPGAADAITAVRNSGVAVRFLTNIDSRTPHEIALDARRPRPAGPGRAPLDAGDGGCGGDRPVARSAGSRADVPGAGREPALRRRRTAVHARGRRRLPRGPGLRPPGLRLPGRPVRCRARRAAAGQVLQAAGRRSRRHRGDRRRDRVRRRRDGARRRQAVGRVLRGGGLVRRGRPPRVPGDRRRRDDRHRRRAGGRRRDRPGPHRGVHRPDAHAVRGRARTSRSTPSQTCRPCSPAAPDGPVDRAGGQLPAVRRLGALGARLPRWSARRRHTEPRAAPADLGPGGPHERRRRRARASACGEQPGGLRRCVAATAG